MPLHLLGKKSWNVYNHDNIQKVKRDEAAAKAIEEVEEQRMQEEDAARRMQILRGETPTPILEKEQDVEVGERLREGQSRGPRKDRKMRKGTGENQTDFEMRLAQTQTSSISQRQVVLRNSTNAPLVDQSGHIDLFPQEQQQKRGVEKNEEAEKESARKKKEYEDQYTMRFSNAAGFKQGLEKPWYSTSTGSDSKESMGKNVWGNDDPRRKEREAARVVSNDPLAMMKQGAAKVRDVEKERKRWREEKESELRQLKAEERRRKRKRLDHNSEDEFETFALTNTESSTSRRTDNERRHRHKHREPRRDDEDSRRKHKYKHRDRER